MIIKKKNRYLLVMSSDDIDAASQGKAIGKEMMQFMGELHYSQANPRIMAQYNSRMFAIQSSRGHEKQVMLALSFVKNLNGRKIGLYTIKTSGSIKTLENFAHLQD